MRPLARRISLAAVMLFLLPVATASAAAPSANAGKCFESGAGGQLPCLPIDRWLGVMPTQVREGTWSLTTLAEAFNQSILGILANLSNAIIGVGNAFYHLAMIVARMTDQITISDGALAMVDTAVGSVYNSLDTSGVLIAFILFAVVVGFWRGRRGGFKALLQSVIAVLILFVMVSGASDSTYDPDEPGKVSFGKGSPGWMIHHTNNFVTSTVTKPVRATQSAISAVPERLFGSSHDEDDNVLSCASYIKSLDHAYENLARSGSKTQAVSQNWTNSGLVAWQTATFGNNYWARKVGCRLLELTSGEVSPEAHAAQSLRTADGSTVKQPGTWDAASIAFAATENADLEVALVGWAACKMDAEGTISVEPEWAAIGGSHAVTSDACKALFSTAPGKTMNDKLQESGSTLADASSDKLSAFKYLLDEATWAGDVDTTQSPGVRTFILSLHGANAFGSGATATMFVLAAIVNVVIFVPIMLAVIISQVALLVMGFALFVAVIIALLKGDLGLCVKTAKQTLSLLVFSMIASLLLATISMISGVIQGVSGALIRDIPLAAPLMTGVAPLLAVVVVKMLFKKLHVPDPMSMKGAMAWGSGAMSGGGVGALNLLGAKELTDQARGLFNRGKSKASAKGAATTGAGAGSGTPVSADGRPGRRTGGYDGHHSNQPDKKAQSPKLDWQDPDSGMSDLERVQARRVDVEEAKKLARAETSSRFGPTIDGRQAGRLEMWAEKVGDRADARISAMGGGRTGASWFGHAAANAGRWAVQPRNMLKVGGAVLGAPLVLSAAAAAPLAIPAVAAFAGVRKFRAQQSRLADERAAYGGLTAAEAGDLDRFARLQGEARQVRQAQAAVADQHGLSPSADGLSFSDGAGRRMFLAPERVTAGSRQLLDVAKRDLERFSSVPANGSQATAPAAAGASGGMPR